jgi:guanylate cyclase
MKELLKMGFARIARIGADPADDDDIQLKKSVLVVCAISFMFAGFAWGLMYISFNEPLAGAIPFSYSIISLFSLLHFGLTSHYRLFRFSQLILILLLPFFLMMVLGGFVDGSAVILWALICPLGALLFDESRHALRWFLAFLCLVIISGFLPAYFHFTNNLSSGLVVFFFVINFIGVGLIIFLMVSYFVAQKNMFQEKSEALLLNILPEEIAAILKRESRTIADQYDEASILFADMVGFTCPRRIANYRLNTGTWTVVFPKATFSTLPCHEKPAGVTCPSVDNTRKTPWTWRGLGYHRRQPSL